MEGKKIDIAIDRITEEQAKEYATAKTDVKGYTVYFVEFDRPLFGKGCVVFKNGHLITYQYQSRYPMITDEAELRAKYIEALCNTLFTEKELTEPLKDYDEYLAKLYFMYNHYCKQIEHISAYRDEAEVTGMTFDCLGCFYTNDKDFVKNHERLYHELKKHFEAAMQGYQFAKDAFHYEMINRDAIYSMFPNFNVLNCFGDIDINADDDARLYLDQLNFSDTQRKAYADAQQEYLNERS